MLRQAARLAWVCCLSELQLHLEACISFIESAPLCEYGESERRIGEMTMENPLKQMNLRQKIGQIVCMRANAYKNKMEAMLGKGEIGAIGAGMFARDCTDVEEAVRVVNQYIAAAQMPLLLYMDAEEGITDYFNFGTSFPTLMALGATFSRELAYGMGRAIAEEAASIGFRLLGSPVLDVNTNPDNPIIGTRAFSDRTELAIQLGSEYVRGMQEAGVIPLGKHFPGHGDTHEDSHMALPSVDRSRTDLLQTDMKPFIALIQHGLMGIMTSHIVYATLLLPEEEKVPATLSKTIITDLLRTELNFNGIIVSDSLAMRGIKDRYGEEQCAVRAIRAGHDIILQDYGSDPEHTIAMILSAVQAGSIAERQIDESIGRIERVKKILNIGEGQILKMDEVKKVIDSEQHRTVARQIADQSVTILEKTALPFPRDIDSKILVVVTASEEEGTLLEDLQTSVKSKSAYFCHAIKFYSRNIDFMVIREDPAPEQIKKIEQSCSEYAYVIYAAFVRMVSYKEGSGTIPERQLKVIDYLNRTEAKVAFMIFGSPYFLRKLDRLQNCLCMYSDCIYSIDSGLKALFGQIRAQGKLPVTINETYTYGYGL